MRLSLKVAYKVYLGFGIIVALLIASSLVADNKLDHISDSTLQVNDLAVPVLKQSNQLQITLLKQAKLSTLSYNYNTLTQLAGGQQQFELISEQFEQQQQRLARLVKASPGLSQGLSSANDSYAQYHQAVQEMLVAAQARIELSQTLEQAHEALKVAIDDSGALLIELIELEEGDADVRGTLAGTANQFDGFLFKFLSIAQELVTFSDPQKVRDSKEEIGFTISDLNAQIDYLNTLAEQVNQSSLMAQFVQEYTKVSGLLVGDNSLLDIKLEQLAQISAAAEQLAVAETHVNQATSHLDNLLKAIDKQFNTLQQQVLTDVDDGQNQLRSTMLLLTVIALAAGVVTTRSMVGPLEGINQVLRYMAQGDLSRKLNVKSKDEFGELSTNINDVVSELTSMIQKIVQDSTKLTTNLTAVAEKSSKEIMEMSGFVEQQRVKVDEVNQITEQMNESTHLVSKQANTAVAEMVEAQQQSQRVDNIAQTNNQRIGDLALKLDQTTENINQLQEESSKIGGIIETIRSIAEQTNLLALNAAIEAARAGEQGRGFAVVADEVRSLAGRTQQSTIEIQTMIEKLRGKIDAAVADISSGKQQVNECVKYTDELTQSLAVINDAIKHIHSMNAEIADSAQLQRDKSNQIKDKVSDVLSIAEKNAEKSRSTLQSSNQIASLADELDSSVQTFKV